MEPQVLYADDVVLVVFKPAGLLAAPGGGGAEARPHVPGLLSPTWGPLWVVQRLDRDAAGVLLLARTPQARRALGRALDAGRVQRVFHALVRGNPPWAQRDLTWPLRVNVGRRKRTVVAARGGRPAHTVVRVLERFGSHALVEAQPRTHRRHQVRVHLYAAGHPVAGDPLYGPGPLPEDPLPGLALLARHLRFPHPLTGQEVRVRAPDPPGWAQALDALRWEKALVDRETAS